MSKWMKWCGALVLGAAVMLSGCEKSDKEKIHVYTWADYINPELLAEFEKANNCEVVVDTFDSNETMFAKLMAGASGYDIIMPTEYVLSWLIKADLIDKLEMTNLPTVVKNFDRKFETEFTLVYNIPYAFSCTGILYRKDKAPEDLKFEDWNDMFDSRLGGRICMMNDIREIIGLGLKMKGYSVNSVSKKELDEAVEVVKDWKRRCSKMDNEAYRTGIPSGEFYAAMSYNSDAIQLLTDGQDMVGFTVPTNGTTSCMDVFCILKSSTNKKLAYKFIDMFYNLENAVRNAEYNGVPMPVVGLFDALSDDYKKIPFMRVTDELKAKCENIKDVGAGLELYTKAWDEIKSNK